MGIEPIHTHGAMGATFQSTEHVHCASYLLNMLQSITCSECEEPQKNGESVSWLANVPCKGQSIHMPVELPENGNKAEASGKVYAHIALAKLGAVFQ